jgi:two-component system response regulator
VTDGAGAVLVVEDNPDHALLVRIAARRAFPTLDVHVVDDGRKAIGYLTGESPYDDRGRHPFPRLVILDLVMPGIDGFGVLQWIGHRPELKELPVVVFTSSINPGDEAKSLALGAVAFHTKPADLDELSTTVRGIVERWLT